MADDFDIPQPLSGVRVTSPLYELVYLLYTPNASYPTAAFYSQKDAQDYAREEFKDYRPRVECVHLYEVTKK